MPDISEDILRSLSANMSLTPQPPRWHGEGDVLVHTRMVCDRLVGMPEYLALPQRRKDILLAAARLHDIGKTAVTRTVAGLVEAPGHAPAGARMARERLWMAGMCGTAEKIAWREAVCALIRLHSLPPHVIDSPDAVLRLHRAAAWGLLLPDFTVAMLCMLAKADMLGRVCPDSAQMLEQIELCRLLAADEGCLDGCFPFPDAHTRRAFLSGRQVAKDQPLYDDTWGTVYLMCGLPGTGKDTWIQRNLPDLPMVSLDAIRRERRISPKDNQGLVANLAKDEARAYLRRHEPFVWNATNITEPTRAALIGLFESYGAAVHIVYLETGLDTLLERNRNREHAVPESAIRSMLAKLVPPLPSEAACVTYISV